MRKTTLLALAGLTATAALAVAVGQASANSLRVSDQHFRATWNSYGFVSDLAGIRVSVRCRITLEGSFHEVTVAKAREALIGAITRAEFAHPCEGGEGWALNGRAEERSPNTLPWHLTYESFSGTLPTIEGITVLLSGFRFLYQISAGCSASYGTSTDNLSYTIERSPSTGALGTITSVEGRSSAALVTRLGGVACPSAISLFGTGTFQQEGSTEAITLSLI